jgi:NAD(P)-dependent dehydrogenase (short-subunit alcohol dehydrogenase family)
MQQSSPGAVDLGSVEGKVIVITGAGQGIGRAIALAAGQAGAKVVVNDLGTAPGGEGADGSVAQKVADEIRAAGGEAVASTDSIVDVTGAARIVQAAVDGFGRVDCIVNNAGIVRDRMFHNMSDEEWDAVIKVHLYGYYYVSRAAAPHFKAQNSGSFIHFSSPAGLIGAVGQVNYASAKMGVVGMSRAIALDMAKFNVRSNCIAPSAWSRLLEAVPRTTPEAIARAERVKVVMSAEKIAPMCLFLASDSSKDVSGQVFAVRGNEIFLLSQPRVLRSAHRSDGWTSKAIAETVLPSFRTAFYPLEHHLQVFSWDPI